MNGEKIKEQIAMYKSNKERALKSRKLDGAIGFCNGAISELSKMLKGEYN